MGEFIRKPGTKESMKTSPLQLEPIAYSGFMVFSEWAPTTPGLAIALFLVKSP